MEANGNSKTIGNGKHTIVFVHYFGGNADSWSWMVAHLKEEFTCVLLNLPGFGNTPPLDIRNIPAFAKAIQSQVERLALKDYSLCGHSMGGKLVVYAAHLLKDNPPKKLLLVAPSPPTTEDMSETDKKRMLNHPDLQEAKNTVDKVTLHKLPAALYEHAVNSQLEIEDATWDWWIEEGMNENIAQISKSVHVPSHVIYALQDPVISIKDVEEEILPNLYDPQPIPIADSAHLIPMELPRELADTIKEIFTEYPLV